eukprot:scaffold985_cov145-Skeletonema_menzelii.AAC.12
MQWTIVINCSNDRTARMREPRADGERGERVGGEKVIERATIYCPRPPYLTVPAEHCRRSPIL